jgi:oligoribonuclease NrnB/cAMP/cGMP phosphodiesterase (DHH superfamily)
MLIFTEPYKLHKVLARLPKARKIVISDLGPNVSTVELIALELRKLVEQGSKVEWYDHHRWEAEWIRIVRESGAKIYIDNTLCAAAVIAKYAPNELNVEVDSFSEQLARITCAADLWTWSEYMAGWLYRVVERYHGGRGDKWRRMIVKGFYEGSLWWPDLQEALEEYVRREFKGFKQALAKTSLVTVDDCKIVGTLKPPGPPAASIVAAGLLSRYSADIAVIVRRRGKGLSLRSRTVNVREVAVKLGGGGHPRAAGAPLNMPLAWRLLTILIPSLKLSWALRAVAAAVRELGGCTRLRL